MKPVNQVAAVELSWFRCLCLVWPLSATSWPSLPGLACENGTDCSGQAFAPVRQADTEDFMEPTAIQPGISWALRRGRPLRGQNTLDSRHGSAVAAGLLECRQGEAMPTGVAGAGGMED